MSNADEKRKDDPDAFLKGRLKDLAKSIVVPISFDQPVIPCSQREAHKGTIQFEGQNLWCLLGWPCFGQQGKVHASLAIPDWPHGYKMIGLLATKEVIQYGTRRDLFESETNSWLLNPDSFVSCLPVEDSEEESPWICNIDALDRKGWFRQPLNWALQICPIS